YDGEEPDDVRHPLQLLPVLPEFSLRRRVGRGQDRQGQRDDEEPGQQERVPGEPAEHTPGEVGRDGRGGRGRDTYDREPDAVPSPERSDPLRPGEGDQRGDRQGDVQAEDAACPQHVGFRIGQGALGVRQYPSARYEDDGDEHWEAHEEQRDRPLSDGNGREFVVLARSGFEYVASTPLEPSPSLARGAAPRAEE